MYIVFEGAVEVTVIDEVKFDGVVPIFFYEDLTEGGVPGIATGEGGSFSGGFV